MSTSSPLLASAFLRSPFSCRSNRPALTLLEITFVLLVFVAIVAGALVIAASTMNQSSTTQESQNLLALASGIQKTKTTKNKVPASNQIGPALYQQGLIPSVMIHTNGTNIKNAWGGLVEFAQLDGGAGFGIGFLGIPNKDCINMLVAVKGGLLNAVGSGAVGSGDNLINILDLTAVQAKLICDAGFGDVYWSSVAN